jgi:hypothetical protein
VICVDLICYGIARNDIINSIPALQVAMWSLVLNIYAQLFFLVFYVQTG